MAKKQNPLLAAFEAQLEAQYRNRLEINSEVDLIAHLISCNEDFEVGPGRAEKALNGFLETKMEIVELVLSDDKDLDYTKCKIAQRLQQVLGPDLWKRYQHFFTLLKDYWEV